MGIKLANSFLRYVAKRAFMCVWEDAFKTHLSVPRHAEPLIKQAFYSHCKHIKLITRLWLCKTERRFIKTGSETMQISM